MRGVLAHAGVGDHGQLRIGLLERPDRHLDDPLVVERARAHRVLVGRDPEQQDRVDPGGADGRGLLDEGGDREPLDAGHRGNVLADVGAGGDEQRLDQVRGGQLRLAGEAAEDAGPPQPPHPCRRKCHRPGV